MLTAREWKEFYRTEREQLGERGLLALFNRTLRIELDHDGAIVIPHTRLSASGHLIAAAARAVVESKCETVLALGVLHGRDRDDAKLRRVHGEEVEVEEFSLDNFRAFVELAAREAGVRPPHTVARYPYLSGETPRALDGLHELRQHRAAGAMLVATTDPIHHGAGYDTPAEAQLSPESAATHATASDWIGQQFAALARRDYRTFLSLAQTARSDFRDVGPVLAELVPGFRHEITALELVDYADVLNAPRPTWVAAALVSIS